MRCSPIKMWVVCGLFVGALGCKEQIVHDMNETEINRLMTKLSVASLHPSKVKQADGRWALSVPSSESIAALTFLADNRILREERSSPQEQSSFISSRDDQRFALERKLSSELEATLAAVAGILESRVHLNLPPVDPLFGQPIDERKGSASVLIVVEEDATIERDAIASLVAGASGITKEKVSVLLSRAWQATTINPELKKEVTESMFASLSPIDIATGIAALIVLFGGGTFVIRRAHQRRLREIIAFHEAPNS